MALRNALVLRHIFIHLPTRELIKSCSLVNKTWNIQTRTFIRNHRDCWVHILPCNHTNRCSCKRTCKPCTSLAKLDNILNNFNVVPINCMSIKLSPSENKNLCWEGTSDEKAIEEVVKLENVMKFKVKNLHIDIEDKDFSCAAQTFVAQLFCENSQNLKVLNIERLSPYFKKVTAEKIPQLPKLEYMTAGSEKPADSDENENFYRNIIQRAPNLRGLDPGRHYMDVWELRKLLPDVAYHKILNTFHIDVCSRKCFKKNLKIAKSNPALSRLIVADAPDECYRYFLCILKKLLHSSQDSLTRLGFCGRPRILDIFTYGTWPSLKNLKELEFRIMKESQSSVCHGILNFIQYESVFPALQKVHIDSRFSDADELFNIDYGLNIRVQKCPSLTLSELVLSLEFCNVNLAHFKKVFPNVTTLRLLSLRSDNIPCLYQVCRLWPKLKHLQLSGMAPDFWPNKDSLLCGISRAEAEELSTKDEDFLRTVQIVPIRPCITTLLGKLTDSLLVSRCK